MAVAAAVGVGVSSLGPLVALAYEGVWKHAKVSNDTALGTAHS